MRRLVMNGNRTGATVPYTKPGDSYLLLTEEVQPILEAFPVLVRQIRETGAMVEEAVFQVCSTFLKIASRARGSVASTEQVLHQAKQGTFARQNGTDQIDKTANEESQTSEGIAQGCDNASPLLGQSQADLRQGMAALVHDWKELDADISQAVVAIQFQDALSQRLDHVCTALENMAARLNGESDAQQMPVDWVGQIQQRYGMLVDRQAQARVTASSTEADDLGGNIELFAKLRTSISYLRKYQLQNC